jgi:hypothetical protein
MVIPVAEYADVIIICDCVAYTSNLTKFSPFRQPSPKYITVSSKIKTTQISH